jgi:hypothetical protein
MLPEEAFQKVGKSVKLYGKGGGSPAPSNQTVTQTNLPEYARPYFENLLNRTQAQSYQDYTPYGGARVAGFTPEQQGIQQSYANMTSPGQFNQATQGLNIAGGMGMSGAQSGLNQALSYRPNTYNAQQVSAPNLQNYQMAGPQNVASQNFGQAAADYYSSPYQQNVTNIALREAQQKGALDKNALMSGAIGRGTFGGARNALLQAEQNRGLNQQLGDIQAQGSQQGYLNAQQQFQADQARNMQAQLANQQSGLTTGQANLQALLGVQSLGSGQNLTAQQLNQAAGLSANQQNQQGQQYAAGLGQQLYGTGLGGVQSAATGLGALGSTQQASDLSRLGAQQGSAAQQQALQQTQLDTAYQDFLRQRDYPQEQLGFYSNILRGLPVQLASTTQSYQAPQSIGAQIGGLGLAGLGLANALK